VRGIRQNQTVTGVRPASATSATTAGNANNFGGLPPSAYVPSSALQRGTFFLSAGTIGKVLFTDGPLSVSADCTLSAGALTVNVNVASTVANWIWFNTNEAAAGTEVNDSRNDSGTGTFSSGFDRIEAIAPSGAASHGQDAFGVNYPSAGQCFVSAWVRPSSDRISPGVRSTRSHSGRCGDTLLQRHA
jgi:hypothetical protein